MKSLRESLLDDNLIDEPDKMIKDEIEAFLKENYLGAAIKISNKPNKDGKYEVSSTKDVNKKPRIDLNSLTNGMFIWTIVDGSFRFSGCPSLNSLEGAPKEVGGDFEVLYCKSLKSLEGAPKEVGGWFYCYGCASKFTEDDVKKISNVKGKIIC